LATVERRGRRLAIVAIGAAAIIGYHVHHLMQFERWAAGPIAGVVPEGRGAWRVAFSALHRRFTHTHRERARSRRHAGALSQRGGCDPRRHDRARSGQPYRLGQSPRAGAFRFRISGATPDAR
jgi:hypothetical protein